jgi:hypothetical protein
MSTQNPPSKDGWVLTDEKPKPAASGGWVLSDEKPSPKPAALSPMTTPLPGAAAGPSIGSGTQQAASPMPSQGQQPQFDAAGEPLADGSNLEPAPFEEADRQAYLRSLQGEPEAVAPARVRNAMLDRRAASRAVGSESTVPSGTQGVFTRNANLPIGEPDERDQAIQSDYAKSLGMRNELGGIRGTIERLDAGADSGLDRFAKFQFDAVNHQQRKLEGRADRVYALLDQGVPPEQLQDEVADIQSAETYLNERQKWLVQNLPKSETQKIIEQRQKEALANEKDRGVLGTLRAGEREVALGLGESLGQSAAGLARVAANLTGTSDGYSWDKRFSDFVDESMRKDEAYLPPSWLEPLSQVVDVKQEDGTTKAKQKFNIMPNLLRGAGGMGGLVLGAGATGRVGSLLGKFAGEGLAAASPVAGGAIGEAVMGAGAQAGRTAGMFFPEFDGQVRRAVDAGVDEDLAERAAAPYALASAMIEEFNPQAYIKVPGLKSQLQKGFIDAIKEGVPANAKSLISHVASKAGNEGLKEALETTAQKASELATNRVVNAISGSDMQEDIGARDFINEVAASFVLGGAFGAMHHAGDGKKMRQSTAEAIRFAAENPQAVEQMIAARVPEAEQDKFRERLDRLAKTYKGNNLSELPTRKGAKVASLVTEKQEVEKQAKDAPMDPILEAAQGNPLKRRVNELTSQILKEMGMTREQAAAAKVAAGAEKAPEGTKAITNPDGSVTLEKKPETGGATAPTATASVQPAKKQESTSNAVASVFSADEATGVDEEPTAAPAESSAVEEPVRDEAATQPTVNEDQQPTEAPAAQAPEDTGDLAGVPPAPEPAAAEPVANTPERHVTRNKQYVVERGEDGQVTVKPSPTYKARPLPPMPDVDAPKALIQLWKDQKKKVDDAERQARRTALIEYEKEYGVDTGRGHKTPMQKWNEAVADVTGRMNRMSDQNKDARLYALQFLLNGGKINFAAAKKELGSNARTDLDKLKKNGILVDDPNEKSLQGVADELAQSMAEQLGTEAGDAAELRTALIDALGHGNRTGVLKAMTDIMDKMPKVKDVASGDAMAAMTPEDWDNVNAVEESRNAFIEYVQKTGGDVDLANAWFDDEVGKNQSASFDHETPERQQQLIEIAEQALSQLPPDGAETETGTPDAAPGEVDAGKDDRGVGKAEGDKERQALADQVEEAKAARVKFEKDFRKRAQSLFDTGEVQTRKEAQVKKAPEPGMFAAEGDTRATSSDDFAKAVKPYDDAVASAEKALADYVNAGASRAQAAAQQTSIDQAPTGKELWQMTRAEANDAATSKNPAPQRDPQHETLKAIADKANRVGYDPDALTPERLAPLREAKLISRSEANPKLTDDGRSALSQAERDFRDETLSHSSASDEASDAALDEHRSAVEKAVADGKPVPAQVLEEYGITAPKAPAQAEAPLPKKEETTYEAKARKAAAALEKAKLKPDQLYALPLPPSVWNGAIRAMQEVIIAGGKAADAISAAIKHIQNSDWWKNKATQKEKDEVTKHLQGRISDLEAAIAAEDVASLKQNIQQARATGAQKTRAKQQEARKEFVQKVKDAMRPLASRLSAAQAKLITARAAKVNPTSDASVKKLEKYAEKVIAKADYAEKVAAAEKTAKAIDKAAKKNASEKRDAGLNSIAREFAGLDIDQADIDQYTDIANRLLSNLTTPKVNRKVQGPGSVQPLDFAISNKEVSDYIEKQQKVEDAQAEQDIVEEFEQVRQQLGLEAASLSPKDMADILAAMNGDEAAAKRLDAEKADEGRKAIMKETAAAKLSELNTHVASLPEPISKEKQAILDDLNKIDISLLTPTDVAWLITGVNSIVTNDGWGGMRDFAAKGKAHEFWKQNAGKDFGRPGDNFFSKTDQLAMIANKIARGVREASKFRLGIGLEGTQNAITDAQRQTQEKQARRNRVAEKVGYKDTRLNRYKMMVYGYMTSHFAGTPEEMQAEFDKKAANLRESVARIKDKDRAFDNVREKAKEYEQAVNEVLGDAKSMEALKLPPALMAMVENERAEFAKNQQATIDSARLDYNKVNEQQNDYLPASQISVNASTTSGDAKKEFERSNFNRRLNTEEASSKQKKTNSLRPNSIIDLDFFKVADESYEEAAADNAGARHVAVMREVMSDPRAMEAMGADTHAMLKNAMIDIVNSEENKKNIFSAGKLFDRVVRAVIRKGQRIALAGLAQYPKQATVGFSTMTALGKDAPLYFSSFRDVNAAHNTEDSWQRRLMQGEQVWERAATLGGLEKVGDPISAEAILTGNESAFAEAAKRFYHRSGKVASFTMKPLAWSDALQAQAAWMAFYQSELKKKGVDLNDPAWHEQKDEEAAAFANQAVEHLQNANTAMSMPAIYRDKGGLKQIMHLAWAYSSFALNMKKRMARDIQTLRNGSKEDKKFARASITGSVLETFMYSTMAFAITKVSTEIIRSMMNSLWPPDDDEEEKARKAEQEAKKRHPATQVALRTAFDVVLGGQPSMLETFEKDKIINPLYAAVTTGDQRPLYYVNDDANLGVLGSVAENFVNLAEAGKVAVTGEAKKATKGGMIFDEPWQVDDRAHEGIPKKNDPVFEMAPVSPQTRQMAATVALLSLLELGIFSDQDITRRPGRELRRRMDDELNKMAKEIDATVVSRAKGEGAPQQPQQPQRPQQRQRQ